MTTKKKKFKKINLLEEGSRRRLERRKDYQERPRNNK